jgi:ABC-type nitrate/sulfonate/bicarbonate transport system permease component
MSRRLIQAGIVIAFVTLWQTAAGSGFIDPLILPPLSSIVVALGHVLTNQTLWLAVALTLGELAAAFVLASVCAFVVGFAVSRSAYAVRVFDPLLTGLYAVPTILLFPLFLLFFGIGPPSKIALGASIAFFPIVLNTITGFAQVNQVHIRAARSMGASNAQLFRQVLLPEAFPVVLSGLRMGLVLGFLTILGGETLASNAGLGHEIVTMAERLEPPSMFAEVFVAIGLAMLLNVATSSLEKRGSRGFE